MSVLAAAPKPAWLKVKVGIGERYQQVLKNVSSNSLHTVCQEARCPNIADCWNRGTATLMILGDVCTRSCGFCAVKTGKPPVYDEGEPARVAESVRMMGIDYVVITSVDRDELPDGGSTIWAKTINVVKAVNPGIRIEVLTPDFKGSREALARVIEARPDVFAHNIETVRKLQRSVRPQADYQRSLNVLKLVKEMGAMVKTGIMVGLGETSEEVTEVMRDARAHGAEIFTIGQYLQPSKDHLPVARFAHPDEFAAWKEIGLTLGYKSVASGPLVRSSYHAEEFAVLGG